jgi:hypothetical protein
MFSKKINNKAKVGERVGEKFELVVGPLLGTLYIYI